MGMLEKIGPTLKQLIFKLLTVFIVVLVVVILFFAYKYGMAWVKKRKMYSVTACIHNPDGSFYIDKVGKFRTTDNIDKMCFLSSTETFPTVDPRYIVAKTINLFRYGIGQFAVIDPTTYRKIKLGEFKIELVNLQMKNFVYLEQRGAISRWAYVKEMLAKYGPYITFMILAIVTGVVCWFLMKTALGFFDSAISARVRECTEILRISQSIVPTA